MNGWMLFLMEKKKDMFEKVIYRYLSLNKKNGTKFNVSFTYL